MRQRGAVWLVEQEGKHKELAASSKHGKLVVADQPCVVGTLVGTRVIADGSLLTVDGSRGIVWIHGDLSTPLSRES